MDYFDFKQFRIYQQKAAFKVGTDSVLLGAWTDPSSAATILDIGTGTGLLALMMAQKSPADITAIEPDGQSYEEAVSNAGNSPWSNRINITNTRLQDYHPAGPDFDLIISNPPFFRSSLHNKDERLSRTRHDCDLSSQELLEGAGRLMSAGGTFCLVLPYAESALFIAEAADFGLYCNRILKVKPLPSSPVKRVLMEFGRKKKELHQAFLTIEKGERHEYTAAYRKLTAAYYLYF
ncbi:MAG: methyltransferase [Bacteroidales bacterium]|nr:methyltransferase [Bacteroidales bacterium]